MRLANVVVGMLSMCCVLSSANAADVYRWVDPATGKTMVSDQPPPGSYRRLTRTQEGGAAEGGTNYAARMASQKYPVVLYTIATCVEECRAARDVLNKRGVPFTENMIQKREDFEALKALAGNPALFPTVKIGSQVQRGLDEEAWNNLLDLAGYPKTAAPNTPPSGGIPATR